MLIDDYESLKGVTKWPGNISSNAFYWYEAFIASFFDEEVFQRKKKILSYPDIKITEWQATVKSHIDQGQFREKLLSKYKKCVIIDIDILQVLVTSYIKRRAASDNKEKLNANNELLCSATYDRLFDLA